MTRIKSIQVMKNLLKNKVKLWTLLLVLLVVVLLSLLSDDWSVLTSPVFREFLDWLLTDNSSITCQYAELSALAAGLLAGGSALSSITGSLLGAKAGRDSQVAANEANLRATRETNLQNYQLFQEQKEFDREMWQKQLDLYDKMWKQQTDYNSPREQVKRLEEAGLNPTLMMSNLDTGQVQTPYSPSAPTSPSAPQMQTPHVEAYDPTSAYINASSGISSAVNDYFNNQYISEKAKGEHIDNITRLQENKARIAEILSRKDLNQATRDKYKAEEHRIDYLLEMEFKNLSSNVNLNNEQARTQQEQQKLLRAESRMRELSAQYQEAVNRFLPTMQQAELKEVHSRISANNASAFAQYESGKLSKAQAATEAVNKTIRQLEKKGIHMDLRNKPKMISLTLKGMKYQNEISKLQQKGVELDNRQKGADYWNPFRYLGPTGASAAGAAILKAIPK